MAIATACPTAECTGIDNATEQIVSGRQAIHEIGLNNIELINSDFGALTDSSKHYDYIICHGVFSWIPTEQQDRLLATIKQLLAPQGLAYLSYNCLPGWQSRDALRRLLLEQTDAISDNTEKIRVARELMGWLLEILCDDYSPYALGLKSELENIQHHSDSFILHELLNSHTSAMYFSAFAKKLAEHHLRFMCEARFGRTLSHRLTKEGVSCEKCLSTSLDNHQLNVESFLSYIYPTALRRSLICHDHQIPLNYPRIDQIRSFFLASPLVPTSPPELHDSVVNEYAAPQGFMVEVKEPLFKEALAIMADKWPQAISFKELSEELSLTHQHISKNDKTDKKLIDFLFDFYCQELIELYSAPLPFTLSIRDKPQISALARWQLQNQNWATNLRHEYVILNEFGRSVAKLCNGRNSPADIANAIQKEMTMGNLEVAISGQKVIEPDQQANLIEQSLSETLTELSQKALMNAD